MSYKKYDKIIKIVILVMIMQMDKNIKEEAKTENDIVPALNPNEGNPPMLDDDFGPDHVWVDDGTTSFANMELTRSAYKQKNKKKHKDTYDLNKKEHFAVTKAAYLHYLPVLLCGIAGFSVAMLIIVLWLS